MNKKRLPSSAYNPISMVGAVIAIVNFVIVLSVLVYDSVFDGLAPYAGIIAYIILPAGLVMGLLIIPVGMFLERRRRSRAAEDGRPRSIYIDLSKASHRRASVIFVSVTIIFLLSTAIGSYRAYEFTESVTFCGKVCHSVMEPEFVAYQKSPHARVPCTGCHVGAGASWYVRSKLSGSYQVYATLFNLYPRPIPTPIEHLRPARETCEQCHWPQKFHGSQEKVLEHYLPDEENTPWSIRMLIKTGGGSKETGVAEGIHWHMNIANEIDYIATDDKRQEIAWVRVKDHQGNVREYMNQDDPIDLADSTSYEMRRMDCIDCHNRPTHIYESPSRAVNKAISAGVIDRTLPSAKRIAIEAMIQEYATKDSAFTGIRDYIENAYEEEYPDVLQQRAADVESLISGVQKVYSQNFFPEMKVSWEAYPDNIGHFNSPGCFRCHNGMFESEDGLTISNDCTSCHTIIAQGSDPKLSPINPQGLEFKHPVDIEEAWRDTPCSECHTGTAQL